MALYDLAHQLAREIKNSDEYTRYKELKDKIMSNEATKSMLLDFQKQQINIQSKQINGQTITDEEKEKFENIKELINLNSDIKEYLDAEYRMGVLFNDIQKILFGGLEIGITENEKSTR
ncbi:YlbF family regulator [Halothermothrix orenii]|uniref:UPF0342 protein Hore_03100 n=1 Tax=Halothermothrix orenii (strain H 168 / OCM 544 / DSM 9562) TaxID=373903 RepID=Y3100_HALOH|nr:YlbF family regulator [Halothermothrix orenii]B8D1J4.1 RecName: Full=UPF0342 protein Hore_03100 [Halothermothrix orenii H 168]ACL69071.1 uncharacterized conserved protein [Halothermothrix orenii H 168]